MKGGLLIPFVAPIIARAPSIIITGPTIAPLTSAPPAFVSAFGTKGTSQAITYTVTNVVVAGSNTLLVACMSWFDYGVGTPVTATVKYNTTETFTSLGSGTTMAVDGAMQMSYLMNPTAGTHNVVFGVVSSDELNWDEYAISVLLFTGVNQTIPVGTPATNYNTTNVASSTVTPGSATNDLIVTQMAWNANGQTVTPPSGSTNRYDDNNGADFAAMKVNTLAASSPSTSVVWGISGSYGIGQIAVALKGA